MTDDKDRPVRTGLSRREFVRSAGLAGAGLGTDLMTPAGAAERPAAADVRGHSLPPEALDIVLNVNGLEVPMRVEPRTTLLNALRNHSDQALTGTKLVCDQGACGACTVIVNHKTALSCLLLAVDMVGKSIETVEGQAHDETLSAVQEAFVDRDGLMCGFCTPGFIMSVTSLLRTNPAPTVDDVRHACAGNVCRCGTYPHLFEAALKAARTGAP